MRDSAPIEWRGTVHGMRVSRSQLKKSALGVSVVAATLTLSVLSRHYTKRQIDQRIAALRPDFAGIKSQVGKMTLATPRPDVRTIKLAQFGRKLFMDPLLSRNGQVACATCHQPERSFTDGLTKARGVSEGERNSPTIINSFAGYWFFWDGRADSLAAQAVGPIESDSEHGITRAHVVRRIAYAYSGEYEVLFGRMDPVLVGKVPEAARPLGPQIAISDRLLNFALPSVGDSSTIKSMNAQAVRENASLLRVFESRVLAPARMPDAASASYDELDPEVREFIETTMANFGLAIEAYEKGLVANESAFDRFASTWSTSPEDDPTGHFRAGFGSQEFLGLATFALKGRCTLCHVGGTFSDNQFHNIGLPFNGGRLSLGRSEGVRKVVSDRFNCDGILASMPERRSSESCKDLKFLDPDSPEGIGSFKTPTLRNVAQTAPYMHDGRFKTLRDVLTHYNEMDAISAVGFKEETLKPLGLDNVELDSIELFLNSLTSPVRDLSEIMTVH